MTSPQSLHRSIITSVTILYERDIVVARQHVRKVAELAGFDSQDQIRLATSVSEIARNAFQYAGSGRVDIEASTQDNEAGLFITVTDKGRGIENLDQILQGRYHSRTGMGNGIIGTQRLMDYFDISTSDRGTQVVFGKHLPRKAAALSADQVEVIRKELARHIPDDPFYELQRQNQELMRTLDELRNRQIEMAQLNAELEATNRGVVALYAELDERATYLRRISDLKTQFLSNMTHEFRTPLNSIRMLSSMLLERVDGPLAPEQEKQVGYIMRSAEELSGFVDNLLDLAKVEAGRLTMRLSNFDVHSLFDVLKGMLKPLTKESAVSLIFEDPPPDTQLFSDEGKVSQILRNFISNALKFTSSGEVRVRAYSGNNDDIIFCVADTGIGISRENLDIIFEEFGQVENAMQSKSNGTGLGLPLSRRLATLLGGKVWVESELGRGSNFFLSLPERHDVVEDFPESIPTPRVNPKRVLLIDDDEVVRYVLQTRLETESFQVVQATNGLDGIALAENVDAIFLDISMPGIDGFEVLKRLKAAENSRHIPVIICTSLTLSESKIAELKETGATEVIGKGKSFAQNAIRALGQVLKQSLQSAEDV